jgi:predicted amidophosphoribosyltransferase
MKPTARRLARLEALATALGALPSPVCAVCGRSKRRAGPLCLRCCRASPSGKRRERERKRRERERRE